RRSGLFLGPWLLLLRTLYTRAELLVLPSPETSTPLESSGTSTPSMPPLEDSVEELTTEFHTPPTISEPST
ncbi:unnamed protein product, partial [Ixodes pacificus]